MKKLVLSLVLISLFSCSDDDDQSNSSTSGCSSGQVCDAAAASAYGKNGVNAVQSAEHV